MLGIISLSFTTKLVNKRRDDRPIVKIRKRKTKVGHGVCSNIVFSISVSYYKMHRTSITNTI